MAEIRLSKLTKQFNIGLSTLVEFLSSKGVEVEMNPNAKISDEYLRDLEAKFGDEQKLKQDSEKVAIKLKEIIELGSKKKNQDVEEDDEPVQEIIIKSNNFTPKAPAVEKPAGKPVEKQEKETVPAPKPSEVPTAGPEPVQEPVKAEIPAESGTEAEPAKQEKPAVSVQDSPNSLKIVDKIDLSKFSKPSRKAQASVNTLQRKLQRRRSLTRSDTPNWKSRSLPVRLSWTRSISRFSRQGRAGRSVRESAREEARKLT